MSDQPPTYEEALAIAQERLQAAKEAMARRREEDYWAGLSARMKRRVPAASPPKEPTE